MSNIEPWIAEMKQRLTTVEGSVAAGAIGREWFGEPRDGVPLRELRQHTKPVSFSLPAMPIPMHAADLVFMFATLLSGEHWRRQYADEREIPEYIDHGGES